MRPRSLARSLAALPLPRRAPPPSVTSDSPPFVKGWLVSCGDRGVSPSCVVESLVTEHCNEQGEEAIGDASEGAAVAVTELSQGLVVVFGPGIALGADAGPVVEGVAQAVVTTVASADGPTFAALTGHWRDTAEGAQSVVISLGKKLRSFGEHRGGDDSSDPWQRQKDGDVAMLAPLFFLSDFFVRCGLDGFGAEFVLSQKQLQPW